MNVIVNLNPLAESAPSSTNSTFKGGERTLEPHDFASLLAATQTQREPTESAFSVEGILRKSGLDGLSGGEKELLVEQKELNAIALSQALALLQQPAQESVTADLEMKNPTKITPLPATHTRAIEPSENNALEVHPVGVRLKTTPERLEPSINTDKSLAVSIIQADGEMQNNVKSNKQRILVAPDEIAHKLDKAALPKGQTIDAPSSAQSVTSKNAATSDAKASSIEVALSRPITLVQSVAAEPATGTLSHTVINQHSVASVQTSAVMVESPISQSVATTPAVLTAHVGSQAWANQLQQNVLQMVMHNQNEITLRLHPVELGPLQVQLRVDDTTAQLNILTNNQQVRGALEQAMPNLRDALASQGIQLSESQVSEQGQQFTQQHSRQAQEWSTRQNVSNSEYKHDNLDDAVSSDDSLIQQIGFGQINTFA